MDSIFGKIIDVTSGQELYIRELPLVLGRYSKKEIDDKILQDSKSFIGKTIVININKPKANQLKELKEHKIKNKLILTNCKRVFPYHLILFLKEGEYKLQILGSCYINSKPFPRNKDDNNKILTIKSNDKIAFDCQICRHDHLYTFIFSSGKENIINKNDTSSLENNLINGNENMKNLNDLRFPNNYPPDNSILKKWTIHEKFSLKKYILLYGYNRWNKIRINSGGVLNEKSNLELKVMSNSFIRCIMELLPSNKENIKEFLLNLIEEKNNEPYILPSIEDWGNLIKKRALIWGKRIQLLYIINQTIEKFKNEIISNKNLHENFQIENINEEEENYNESKINSTNDIWDNLLNFLPSNIYFGHKPCFYWERIHDIDLLRGTYKYGYGNYSLMRKDTKFSFYILDKNSFQEFPNANSITRRLKTITQMIMKNDNIKNGNDNDKDNFIKESTIFSLDEKNNIVNYLINFGIPINSQGKSDYNSLKEKLLENNIIQERKNEKENYLLLKNFDELINKLKILEENLEEEIKRELYSDDDGFNLDYETTDKLIKNLNLFDFIRKNIISQNFKLFNDGLKKLKQETKKGNSKPEKCKEDFWNCSIHDKELISFIEEKGLKSLNNEIKENQNFKDIPLTSEEYLERLIYLYNFFLKFKKNKIPTFPLEINKSLTLLNLGKIEYKNYNYHSKNNLFPIGYRAIRVYQSMFNLGQRAKYTCEILDGGIKPQYKLTSSEDPNNPIIRESSTACWSYVCNKINDLKDKKRKKVTVSGTQKFGLCEPLVIKLLHNLPGADKCAKYEKK